MTRITSVVRETPDGPEKLCTACLEWWPADAEFFHRQSVNGVMKLISRCRACELERKAKQRAAA